MVTWILFKTWSTNTSSCSLQISRDVQTILCDLKLRIDIESSKLNWNRFKVVSMICSVLSKTKIRLCSCSFNVLNCPPRMLRCLHRARCPHQTHPISVPLEVFVPQGDRVVLPHLQDAHHDVVSRAFAREGVVFCVILCCGLYTPN